MDKNMEDIQDESGSSCSSGTRDLFGDPEISPRIGDEYQVEIPPLMTKDELLQLMEDPIHLGLPIPVVWVLDQCENINKKPANPDAATHVHGPVDSESSEEKNITVSSEDVNGKVETLGSVLDNAEEIAGEDIEIDLVSPQEKARSLEGCLPVPGLLLGEAWKEIERDSILLGLYIFGKNLTLVKKLVGSKGMGEILSYYHGKFYKSSEYNRWLECRKKRKKRVPYGEKIFTSWRQQELMSRLSSHVSEECKTRLIEASSILGEGKMPLQEYVLALKDMVGLKVLVEAVAIGKGKRDLMSLSMDPAKTNLSLTTRPGIPSGKSGSSLTVDEIVKFLTGDIRLSKARANDLFWDAVWPRLLDNGWRVETPRNYVSLSSKQSWVYLIPGVKKFSRRKLVKGTHYFDSVTDVLNKVAVEPKLLEPEPNAANEEGSGPGPQAENGTDGFSSRERHSYLQPRVFGQEQIMKFTIVDTSLVCRNETAKVIELRTLPVVSGGIEQNTIKESRNVVQKNDIANGMEDEVKNKQSVDSPSLVINNYSTNGSDPMILETDKHEDQKQQRLPMKFKFIRKVKSSQPNDVGPTTTKKPELTPCNNRGRSSNAENNSTQAENNSPQAETFRKPSLVNSLESSPAEKNEETWIDLNLPHTPQDSDRDRTKLLNPPQASDRVQQAELLNPSGTVSGQRQSRRNRPLTTKALEALACGYLSPKKKRKSGETAIPRPSRRVRGKTALLTSCGVSIEDEAAALHKMEKAGDGVFNGTSNMVSTSQK